MAMHPENSGSEKKILVEVEHTTNGAGTPGGTEENQTGEGQVETGRSIAENRSDEFRTDLGDDTDGMSGEGSHGKAAGVDLRNYQLGYDRDWWGGRHHYHLQWYHRLVFSNKLKELVDSERYCFKSNLLNDLDKPEESDEDEEDIQMPDPTYVAGPSHVQEEFSLENLSRQISEMARLQN
ncbi:hypothetical protein V8G54_001557 [Vigna mungo]|uniref:Uncharacterized protein n=1 Tax=Vigna mungo TaxID=3915 RepID=A0AAQ3SB26_VIGMU